MVTKHNKEFRMNLAEFGNRKVFGLQNRFSDFIDGMPPAHILSHCDHSTHSIYFFCWHCCFILFSFFVYRCAVPKATTLLLPAAMRGGLGTRAIDFLGFHMFFLQRVLFFDHGSSFEGFRAPGFIFLSARVPYLCMSCQRFSLKCRRFSLVFRRIFSRNYTKNFDDGYKTQ